jgi:hypothetical protein
MNKWHFHYFWMVLVMYLVFLLSFGLDILVNHLFDIKFLWVLYIMLPKGMFWNKFRFNYYARFESMMINFG